MVRHPSSSRSSRKGFALIAVLAGAVLIGGLAATLRARGVAQAMVLSRIEEAHRVALGRLSVAARVAAMPTAVRIEATRASAPMLLEQDGREWEVRLVDVEGLIDLYLAPPDLLNLLSGNGEDVAQQREVALSDLIPGAKFATEEHTLARLGFDATERAELAPFVTQRARTGEVNPVLAPEELRSAVSALPYVDIAGGELAELVIRLRP